VREALARGELDELLPFRLREDERDGRERRRRRPQANLREQRSGERREPEPDLVQRHREAKTRLREQAGRRSIPWLTAGLVTTIVTLLMAYGLLLGPPVEVPDPQCQAPAAAGVNWRNCKLEGVSLANADLAGGDLSSALLRGARLSGADLHQANLQYADLSGADLSYTDLTEARMKGVNLRNGDLTNADLRSSDLSYADLSGARLGGALLDNARLDNAYWSDGSRCAEGSIGVCIPYPAAGKDSVR